MKNVLVTGARRGLGLAICHRLAREGYRVIAVARSSSPELDELCERRDNVVYECYDLTDISGMHAWLGGVTKRHGRLYGLVNNAAIGNDGVLATMHETDIAELLHVNLHSPIVLSKYASRSMLLNGEGRIVNVSSIIASTGYSGLSVYAATKAGLIGFSKSLAREVGKAGITVNCVAPGYMETAMTTGLPDDKLRSIKRRSPSGQLAGVDDAAAAVNYLLGADGKMVTGAVLTVDAGSTA
ncbi:MAG: SDR family NAD(P)-dependent oxidoreductase [Burkholderiaceae bacterium]|jgi:3-oxoacyl-[acyl-carrier protein] reductase